jgi:hypothetical protein
MKRKKLVRKKLVIPLYQLQPLIPPRSSHVLLCYLYHQVSDLSHATKINSHHLLSKAFKPRVYNEALHHLTFFYKVNHCERCQFS